VFEILIKESAGSATEAGLLQTACGQTQLITWAMVVHNPDENTHCDHWQRVFPLHREWAEPAESDGNHAVPGLAVDPDDDDDEDEGWRWVAWASLNSRAERFMSDSEIKLPEFISQPANHRASFSTKTN